MPVKRRSTEPYVPPERSETIRRQIISVIAGEFLSAKEISAQVGISEKDVVEHLAHIRVMLQKEKRHLVVMPAECKKCGFEFRKRDRLSKPGKCPVCRSEQIRPQSFSLS